MRTLSMTLALGTFALSSLGGCIIYEKDVIHAGHDCGPHEDCDDWGWYDTADTGGDASDPGDPGQDTDQTETAWLFTPNTLAPGVTSILSLTADPVFDYSTVAEVDLYGDASVCAIDVREAEVIVTVSADQAAVEGSTVDALIVTTAGEGIWVEDALIITSASGEVPDGSGGSGDGGADPGTGDDGADPGTGDGGSDPATGDDGAADDGGTGCGG